MLEKSEFRRIGLAVFGNGILAFGLYHIHSFVGVGISVRAGGAPGGDDALAMSLSRLTGKNIKWIYLMSDMVVLALSVSYIPLKRLAYSLLTVVLSGQIIGLLQGKPESSPDS